MAVLAPRLSGCVVCFVAPMTLRVIYQGIDDEATVRQVIKGLLDPDVTSVIVHKPGSYLHADGREMMVDARGNLVPAVHTGQFSEDPAPVGAC